MLCVPVAVSPVSLLPPADLCLQPVVMTVRNVMTTRENKLVMSSNDPSEMLSHVSTLSEGTREYAKKSVFLIILDSCPHGNTTVGTFHPFQREEILNLLQSCAHSLNTTC